LKGVQPAPGEHVQRVRNTILANPPDLILTYKDISPLPINMMVAYLGIQDYVISHYEAKKSWGAIALLKKLK
jgi:hypothetical protein